MRGTVILMIITGLCLALEEWFPFSHFPMYSRNMDASYCLYVTDAEDRVIFTREAYSVQAFQLRKLLVSALREMKDRNELKRMNEATPEQLRAGGEAVIRFLRTKKPGTERIRIWRREFRLGAVGLHETKTMIAEG